MVAIMHDYQKEGMKEIMWPGKRHALLQANTPSKRRLVLSRSTSVNLDNTKHMILEGDNLEILKILLDNHESGIKVIYIDPPYNTKKDRMYNDRHTHSEWLTMMYSRLYVAKKLLADDGTIFISIGLDESHRLRLILDDLFGEENMVSEVVWHSKYTTSNDKKLISTQHEYILVYAKDKSKVEFNLLDRTEKADASYRNPDNDSRGRWKATPLHAKSGKRNWSYKFTKVRKYDGEIVPPFMWSAPDGRYPTVQQNHA